MEKDKLAELRAKIDDIDRQLIELLNRRTQCVIEVGEVKAKEESLQQGGGIST